MCTDVLEATFLFELVLWEEYLKKNMGAKSFGHQGPPGMASSFLQFGKICYGKPICMIGKRTSGGSKICKNHVLRIYRSGNMAV